jgi:hypothetical protein
VLAAMTLLCVLAISSGAAPGDTTRVSVASDGTQANSSSGANGYTTISADGRFVAFYSNATNLVPGDTNNVSDIFVHDRQTRTTERVSVGVSETAPNGVVQANASSFFPASISANGRYVAFVSEASNLVPGDTAARGVFVRDRDTDGDEVFDEKGEVSTVRVSANMPNGVDPNGFPPSISADGRYVAFESSASEGVSDDTNGKLDVFVRDLKPDPGQTQTIVRVSVDSSGNQADDGPSYDPSISADGRFVAFVSPASDLVQGDVPSAFNSYDIFVHDRDADGDEVFDEIDEAGAISTERVSVHLFGGTANDKSFRPSISANGRYVAFQSHASDLVPNDTNGCPPGFCDINDFVRWYADVFVYDRDTETTQRVSVDNCGTQASGGSSEMASISADGRFVAFSSGASILAAGETSRRGGLFVRDRDTDNDKVFDEEGAASTQWMSRGGGPSISADGSTVAFESTASDLVAGDTNNVTDIFAHERRAAQPLTDCIAPATTAARSPTANAAGWNNSDVTVNLVATDSSGGSGVKEITYSATGAQTIASNTVAGSSASVPITAEGTTTVSYFATDNAGNQESPAKTLTVKLDKSVPSAPVISSPANNSFDTDGTITLSGTGEANATIKVFEATASGDTSKGTTPVDASGTWTKILSGVSSGSHSYKAKATDAAGNTSGFSNARAIIVDKVKPKVSTATPTGTGVVRGTNATATFSERMNPTSITTSTFKLFRCSSTTSTNCATQITNVTISRSMDRLKATLNPYGTSSTLLAGRTKYKVVVTTGEKDEAGNQLDQDAAMSGNQPRVWYFTTGSS